LLKYSKHFNNLPCNCSKTFGFLRNCKFQGSVEKDSVAFFNTLLETFLGRGQRVALTLQNGAKILLAPFC
jgi:hypothetical protein